MEDQYLTFTHATERDIDLIIIEELTCSIDFVDWFLKKIGGLGGLKTAVHHSRRRIFNRREIDITLSIDNPEGRSIVLIENKLDTSEQPQQAESYAEEVVTILERGEAKVVTTVIVCPARYVELNPDFVKKFNKIVTYENIHEHLVLRSSDLSGELRARIEHKGSLIQQAITKARRGYQPVALPIIDDFADAYVRMLKYQAIKLEPGPSMLKRGRPGESRTMIFDPSALPGWAFLPQTRLVHQLREGNANINFYTWGDKFTDLAAQMATDLAGTGYRLVPTVNKRIGGRSGLMIVATTPPIDSLVSFSVQRDAIVEGARVTERLKDWFWANRQPIERWAAIAAR